MKRVKHVIFDVDGTLYRKGVEYNQNTGSIQTAHDFFRYMAHQMLKGGTEPGEVSSFLVNEYVRRVGDGTLNERVALIGESEKQEWNALVDEYGANGKVFDYHHGLKERGFENFLHNMLANIDFRRTLDKDPELIKTLEHLKSGGYDLGILTSELYSTIQDVADAMGFDMEDFHIGDNPEHPDLFSESDSRHYPIICRNNSIAKPSTDGFERVMRILGANPEELVYVGDSKDKDIKPPLSLGWRAVLVLNKESPIKPAVIEVDGKEAGYTEIGYIYGLSEML